MFGLNVVRSRSGKPSQKNGGFASRFAKRRCLSEFGVSSLEKQGEFIKAALCTKSQDICQLSLFFHGKHPEFNKTPAPARESIFFYFGLPERLLILESPSLVFWSIFMVKPDRLRFLIAAPLLVISGILRQSDTVEAPEQVRRTASERGAAIRVCSDTVHSRGFQWGLGWLNVFYSISFGPILGSGKKHC